MLPLTIQPKINRNKAKVRDVLSEVESREVIVSNTSRTILSDLNVTVSKLSVMVNRPNRSCVKSFDDTPAKPRIRLRSADF